MQCILLPPASHDEALVAAAALAAIPSITPLPPSGKSTYQLVEHPLKPHY